MNPVYRLLLAPVTAFVLTACDPEPQLPIEQHPALTLPYSDSNSCTKLYDELRKNEGVGPDSWISIMQYLVLNDRQSDQKEEWVAIKDPHVVTFSQREKCQSRLERLTRLD